MINNATGSIGKYNFDGSALNSLFAVGVDGGWGLAANSTNVFYADGGTESIVDYAPDGNPINTALIKGLNINGLAASDTHLFILDSRAMTIGKYTLSGKLVSKTLISGLSNVPVAMGISGTHLFVVNMGLDMKSGSIGAYTTDGATVNASLVSNLSMPNAFAVSETKIYLVDRGGGKIAEYSTTGELLNPALISGLKDPSSVAVAGPYLFVTTNTTSPDKGTVGVYTTSGEIINDELITGLGRPGYITVVLPTTAINIPHKTRAPVVIVAKTPKPQVPTPPLPAPKYVHLPPIIIDTRNYGTENNWLAHHIALRITTLCYLILHPDATTVPTFDITAQVDAKAHTVHLTIEHFADKPITADLKPDFAWDPKGYAALGTQLLDKVPTSSTLPTDAVLPDMLTSLLDPTGANLAEADMLISAQLRKNPAWPLGHEDASLLLVALALRDRAATFTDYRQILCRATAHLALARTLLQDKEPSWTGQIADAGIRVLSGRQADAIAHLDALSAKPDLPDAAKRWIEALRLRATDDWRTVAVDAHSSLLLKIVLAHVMSDDLSAIGASRRMEPMDLPENMPDWGRTALTNMDCVSVETGNTYGGQTPPLELAELSQILDIEHAPPIDMKDLKSTFSGPLQENVLSDASGNLQVIGPDMFADVTRRHLFNEIQEASKWLQNLLGLPDEAKNFITNTRATFAGTHLFELVEFPDHNINYIDLFTRMHDEHRSWEPWEMAMGDIPDCYPIVYPDFHTLHVFYADGLPFGTAYDLDYRQFSLGNDQKLEHDKTPDVANVPPSVDFAGQVKEIAELAPHSFTACQLAAPGFSIPPNVPFEVWKKKQMDLLVPYYKPFWDYNIRAIGWAIDDYRKSLEDDPGYEEVLKKNAELNPDGYFLLANHLRHERKYDEAAIADRKGFDECYDQVAMSNSVGNLVDYYYQNGKVKDALLVAERAAEVYSAQGLATYEALLEKLNRLDEAWKIANALKDRYQINTVLINLKHAHPEALRDKIEATVKEVFPKGLNKIDAANLQGPPSAGCLIAERIPGSISPIDLKLDKGDIVVAVDSFQVQNADQFRYLTDDALDNDVKLVVWHWGSYVNLEVSAKEICTSIQIDTFKSKTEAPPPKPLPPPRPRPSNDVD